MRTLFQRGVERLRCFLCGHRELTPADAYGEELPGGTQNELHYCAACGAAVWLRKDQHDRRPITWAEAGLPEDVPPRGRLAASLARPNSVPS